MAGIQSFDAIGRVKPKAARDSRPEQVPARLRACRLLFGFSILASLLPLGAVNWVAYDFSNAIVALAGLAAMTFASHSKRLLALERAAWFLAVAFMLWVLVQATPFAGGFLGHPIWRAAADLLGPLPATASLDPGASFYALPSVVSPFLAFIASLRLFGEDRAAWRLVGALGVCGGAVALYGLGQYLFFPGAGLVYADVARPGALTAVLVNRNNAATLLGVAALLQFAPIFREIAQLRSTRSHRTLDPFLFVRRQPAAIAQIMLLAVTLTALLLTASRAGVGSTIVGFLVMVVLLGLSTASRRGQRPSAMVGTRLARVVTGAAAVLLVAAVFSGRAWLRVEAGGMEDARFCILPGLLAAVRDNGIFGTGLGSFQQVFQAYRDPSCGLGFVWDHAHDLYLEGVLTLGIPFIAGCLFLIVRLCTCWWRGLRQRRRARAAPAAGAAITVLVALHSVVDFSLQIPGVALFVAAALGGCAVISEGRDDGIR